MSLLDKASLIVTPNAYKESKLYSVVPNTTLGDMDVVRATTATRVNSAGLIEVVPRNLLAYSNDLTNGIWTKTNTTITLNTIANPLNGLVNGQTFTPNTTNADHFAFGSGITVAGQPYIMSFFVKANGYTNCRLGNAATGAGIWFNLSNGTIISGTGGAITALSNGWYLVSYSLTSVGTSVNPLISFAPSTSTNFAGNGTSGGYVFGAQLDQGSTATEYFPTTTRLNIPRIDYTNGSCPSILVEPQRTNLLLQSNNFNTTWTKSDVTINANAAISPDGSLNAFENIEGTGTSTKLILQSVTVSSGAKIAVYFFVKKKNKKYIQIRDNPSTSSFVFNFDTALAEDILGSCIPFIENYGNGWYKVGMTATASLTTSQIRLYHCDNSKNIVYTGDGVSGFYLWGSQLEQGSYATSYVPTVATTVTRNADVISKTGISSLIGQTEGVIYSEFIFTSGITIGRIIGGISEASLSNRLILNLANVNKIQIIGRANGITFFNISSTIALING